ncbi:MAG: thioredoxin [Candidatus Aenigmarchaeota archaeon]|nr:thioredoxin [Candidatus Aenigmarchaeota archaeon]
MVDEISMDEFEEEVVYSDLPVIIDFWAKWCGPCLAFAPTFEKYAKKYEGKVKFFRCNIEKNRSLAEMFEVKSIPTMLFFCEGKVVERITGAYPEDSFGDKIEEFFKKCENAD